jgi:hypothetical protein
MNKKIVEICILTLFIATVGLPAMGSMNEEIYHNGFNNKSYDTVVWDNGLNYDLLGYSQIDSTIGYDWIGADDFMFDEDTKVIAYRWIGGYTGPDYQNANFDFGFQFYYDQGDGNAPGEVFGEPFIINSDMVSVEIIEDTGDKIFYDGYLEFPHVLEFSGGEKYWFSGWGIGDLPLRSGGGIHYDPIQLHQCVGKSEYEGYPDWMNVEDITQTVDGPIDACFQFLTSLAPTIPDINGPSSGKAGEEQDYTVSAIDPDGDDVIYMVDWGDDTGEEEFGPYTSGEEKTLSHTWSEKDTYTIKVMAKDIYDTESEWTELEVEMPKTKDVRSPFLTFLQNHPLLFPLIRQILELIKI